MVNELLLTEEQSSFEVAGHQFELIRDIYPRESTPAKKTPLGRMKFALARPMEIGQPRNESITTVASTSNAASANPSMDGTSSAMGPLPTKWISELIQNAVQPLERQLSDMIEPLARVQHQVELQLERKARRRKESRKSGTQPTVASNRATQPVEFTTQIDVQPQVAKLPETVTVPVISPVVEQMLAQQSYSLTTLGDRLIELKKDLSSLERIVTEIQSNQDASEEPTVVPLVSPVVEAQMSLQSESLRKLEDELRGLSGNLGTLQNNVRDGFAAAASATPAIDLTPVDRAVTQITSLADQLQTLSSQVEGLKDSVGSLERIVEGNAAATKEIAAIPPAASPEAFQQLSNVLDQLGQLIREMHARQIADDGNEQNWREEVRTRLETIQNDRPTAQPLGIPSNLSSHFAAQSSDVAPAPIAMRTEQTAAPKSLVALQPAPTKPDNAHWAGFPSQSETSQAEPASTSPALPQQNIPQESPTGSLLLGSLHLG